MIILNEVIKWGSIIACIVWPVYIIKKGCITYLIEKRISATELQEEKSSLHKKLNTEIEIEKSVMLFHKLALDKEKITSQKIKEALIEIEETYKVIKKKFY